MSLQIWIHVSTSKNILDDMNEYLNNKGEEFMQIERNDRFSFTSVPKPCNLYLINRR